MRWQTAEQAILALAILGGSWKAAMYVLVVGTAGSRSGRPFHDVTSTLEHLNAATCRRCTVLSGSHAQI